MITDRVDKKRHIEAYGIQCQPLARSRAISKASVNVTHCVLEPGSSTNVHQHREAETFFVLSGQGVIQSDSRTVTVGPGHTVTAFPFHEHVLKNTSTSEDFVFLSIYSDAATILQTVQRQVVIAAPPTPNGDLHLGHLGGPYIASDIYQRYLQLKGKQVLFISGTDDFQNYVEAYAEKHGIPLASEVSEKFRNEIQKTLALGRVEFDEMLSPSKDHAYQEFVAKFFNQLLDQGLFEIKELPTFFERDSGQIARESQIQGNCPSCDSLVVGNCCEECGYVGDVNTLRHPKHSEGRALEVRMIKRAVLNLRKLEAQARAFIQQSVFKNTLTRLADTVFKQNALYPASYPGQWGVAVPNSELAGQVINVWIEMAAGYVYLAQKHNTPMMDSRKVHTSLFCGVDNAFYYAILLPMVLQAYNPDFNFPYELQLNEFWNLEGEKFSTSRKHAIWGQDFLRDNKSDDLRFYMAYKRPIYQRENFNMNDFNQSLKTLQVQSIDVMTQTLRDLNTRKVNPLEQGVSPDLLVELQEVLNQYEKNFTHASDGVKKNAHLTAYMILRSKDVYAKFQAHGDCKFDFIYTMRVLGTLLTPYMPTRACAILSLFRLGDGPAWIDDLSLSAAREEMQSFYDIPLMRAE